VLIERLRVALQEEGQNAEEVSFNDDDEKMEESVAEDEPAAETDSGDIEDATPQELDNCDIEKEENMEEDAPALEAEEMPEGNDKQNEDSKEENSNIENSIEENLMEGDPTEENSNKGKEGNCEENENKIVDEVHETVENGDNGNLENGINDKSEAMEDNEDSLNIMIGDEDNLFGDENDNKDIGVNGVIHASPPRPDSIPAKHPFTSKDTITLSSRTGKAPSDNSSMLVHHDECSVASHDSGENKETEDKNGNINKEEKTNGG